MRHFFISLLTALTLLFSVAPAMAEWPEDDILFSNYCQTVRTNYYQFLWASGRPFYCSYEYYDWPPPYTVFRPRPYAYFWPRPYAYFWPRPYAYSWPRPYAFYPPRPFGPYPPGPFAYRFGFYGGFWAGFLRPYRSPFPAPGWFAPRIFGPRHAPVFRHYGPNHFRGPVPPPPPMYNRYRARRFHPGPPVMTPGPGPRPFRHAPGPHGMYHYNAPPGNIPSMARAGRGFGGDFRGGPIRPRR